MSLKLHNMNIAKYPRKCFLLCMDGWVVFWFISLKFDKSTEMKHELTMSLLRKMVLNKIHCTHNNQ